MEEKEGGWMREGEMASRFMIDIDMTAESNKADKWQRRIKGDIERIRCVLTIS